MTMLDNLLRRCWARTRVWAPTLALVVAALALPEPAQAEPLDGVWTGQYSCNGAAATVRITVRGRSALSEYSYPGAAGAYDMSVQFDAQRRRILLSPQRWRTQPAGHQMLRLTGVLAADGASIDGSLAPCSDIRLTRMADAPSDETAAAPVDARQGRAQPLDGTWAGDYACNGATANVRITMRGRSALFEYRYAATAGAYDMGVQFEEQRGRLRLTPQRWRNQPPGHEMLGLTGVLSADGGAIDGFLSQCGAVRLTRAGAAPPVASAAPPGGTRPDIGAAGRLEPPRAGVVGGGLPQGAFETAEARCPMGITFMRVEFDARGNGGRNARVLIRRPNDSRARVFPAEAARSGPNTISVRADAPTSGPYEGLAFELRLNGNPQGPFVTQADDLQCGGIYLRPAAGPASAGAAAIPQQYKHYAGRFEGSVVSVEVMGLLEMNVLNRVSAISPLSLDIVPSTAGTAGRLFDVTLKANDDTFSYGLAIDPRRSDMGLVLVPDLDDERYPRKGERPFATTNMGNAPKLPRGNLLVAEGGGDGAFVGRGRIDYGSKIQGGVVMLRRRPAANTRDLADLCGNVAKAMPDVADGRDAARDLKIAFYPALVPYDVDVAAFNQLSAPGAPPIDKGALTSLTLLCQITGTSIIPSMNQEIAGALLDRKRMARTLYELLSFSSRPVAVEFPNPVLPDLSARAEAALSPADQEVLTGLIRADLTDEAPSDILDRMSAGVERLRRMPPSLAKPVLQPLIDKLDAAFRSQGSAGLATARAEAAARMAGIAVPMDLIDPAHTNLHLRVTRGDPPNLSESDRNYIVGLLDEMRQTCNEPSEAVRLRLMGTVAQGLQALTGLDFAQVAPNSAFGLSVSRQADAMLGNRFAHALGCKSPYLLAFTDLLAKGVGATAVRASLFVRSCAVDLSPAECTCLQTYAADALPGSENRMYSADIPTRIARSKAGVAIAAGLQCGLRDE